MDAIADKILDERIWQRKAIRSWQGERPHASQSRNKAMAAATAWTNRIPRLTVAAPLAAWSRAQTGPAAEALAGNHW
jgi:negative regulator of sigma E activity